MSVLAYSGLNMAPGHSGELPKLAMLVLQFRGQRDKAVDKDGLRDTWNWVEADYTLVTVHARSRWIQREAAVIVSHTMRWWLKSRL
jgi:hypothetical protein